MIDPNELLPETFIALCDPHNSIIHQFGIDSACILPAYICRNGCNDKLHMKITLKHEFIPAQSFYHILSYVREEYKSFQQLVKVNKLQAFIQKVKDIINQFEQHMKGDYFEQYPLFDLFCKQNNLMSIPNITTLIEDPLEQVQVADLNCKEVFWVKRLAMMIQKQKQPEKEERVDGYIKLAFEQFLKKHKCLIISNSEKDLKDKSPQYCLSS